MNNHLRKLIADIDQWSPCMSYNDSYFGEPPGMLKQTVRQLAKEVESQAVTASTVQHYPLTKKDLLELAAKIQEALARQEACTTYDQTYLDYLNAHADLELSIKAAHAKITTPRRNDWPEAD